MVPSANARLLQARRAAEALAQRLAAHAAVALVDVGTEPGGHEIAIRVHVRRATTDPSLPELPREFDGFPVVTIPSEYRQEEEP
jgi:hypothetical protein